MPAFYANLIFLVLINLLVKPLYVFGVDRKVQVLLAEDGGGGSYGLYFALFNFSYLFYMLLDLGLTDYNRRAVAREPERLGNFLPNFLAAKMLLVIVYLLLLFAGAWSMGYGPEALRLLVPLAAMQVFLSLLLYFRSNLGGLHRFRLDGLFSVLDRLLMIGLGAALIGGGSLTVERFAWAQALAYAVASAACGAVVALLAHRQESVGESQGSRIDRREVVQIFRDSLPFALLVLLMTLYGRMDSIFLERLLPEGIGAREADVYARGFRLFDALQNFALLFGHLVAPMFARLLQQNERTETLVRQSFGLLWAFSTTAGIACFFYREQLYGLLYEGTGHGPHDALVLGLLLLAFGNVSAVYIFGSLLGAGNHLRTLNGIALCALLLNVLLNWWLVPEHLALGAAVAALCTQTLSGAAHLFFGVRLMGLRLPVGYWARLAACAGGSAGLFFGAVQLGASWPLFFAALAGSGVLALLTGTVALSWMNRFRPGSM
jgi:O-antigen/teichoic acid export membrane protein